MACFDSYNLIQETSDYEFRIDADGIARVFAGEACGRSGLPYPMQGIWLNYTADTLHLVSGNPDEETEDGVIDQTVGPSPGGLQATQGFFTLPIGTYTIYDKDFFTTDSEGNKTFPRQITIKSCWNRDFDMNQSDAGTAHAGGCCRVSIRHEVAIQYTGFLGHNGDNSSRYLKRKTKTEMYDFVTPGWNGSKPPGETIPAGSLEILERFRDPKTVNGQTYTKAREEYNYEGSREGYETLTGNAELQGEYGVDPMVFQSYEPENDPFGENNLVWERVYSLSPAPPRIESDTIMVVDLFWTYIENEGEPVNTGQLAGRIITELENPWQPSDAIAYHLNTLGSLLWTQAVPWPNTTGFSEHDTVDVSDQRVYRDGHPDFPPQNGWPGCRDLSDPSPFCSSSGTRQTPTQAPWLYDTSLTTDYGGFELMAPPSNAGQPDSQFIRTTGDNPLPIFTVGETMPIHWPAYLTVEPDINGATIRLGIVKRWYSGAFCRTVKKYVGAVAPSVTVLSCTKSEGGDEAIVAPCSWMDVPNVSFARYESTATVPGQIASAGAILLINEAVDQPVGTPTSYTIEYSCPDESNVCACGAATVEPEPIALPEEPE